MRKLIYTLISLIILTSIISISVCESYSENIIKVNQTESGVELNLPTIDTLFKIETEAESEINTHEFITVESVGITDYELYLLCAITQAEAGNQSDLGKELVVVTILNRLHSVNRWGDSIKKLITYSQFNGVANPNFGYRSDETYASVMSAIEKYYKGEYNDEWYKIFYFNNPNSLDSQKYMDKYGLYVIIDEGGAQIYGREVLNMAQDMLMSLYTLIENNKDLSSYELALKIKSEIVDVLVNEHMNVLYRKE